MADISSILSTAENVDSRPSATVRLLLRQDLARQHAELSADLDRAVAGDAGLMNQRPETRALAQRVADLENEIDVAKTGFVFRAIGRRAWVDLIAAHPPTKAQLKAVAATSTGGLGRASLDFNPDAFPVAAVAASCVDPEMTVDDAQRLEAAVSEAQWSQLWEAVCRVNVGSSDPKASRVAGLILRSSEQSGTTAAREESDVPTS